MTLFKIPAIVFDLDGTLIDSLPDVVTALNHALDDAGRRALEADEVRTMLGEGAAAMIRCAFSATGAAIADDKISGVLSVYCAYYLAHPADKTSLFPDVRETLESLHQSGVRMGVCTNKPHDLTMAALAALGLDHWFQGVCCGDEGPYRKPDGRHIHRTLVRMGASNGRAVMVGDGAVDVAAARDAGVFSIFATWGYHRGEANIGADVEIDSAAELPAALARLGMPLSRR